MPRTREEIASSILDRRTSEGGVFPSRDDAVRRLADPGELVFYSGYDPTGPDIHIGHSVSLLLMKALARDLGHSVIVLFGDFTARIGDPTGKESSRRMLSEDEIEEHVRTWDTQIATLFGDVPYTIRRNSEWLSPLTFADVIKLSASVTVQQMLARDMFQERIKREKPIHLNEFLYPLAQGYDSVAMRVDGEVGGNDQVFNMLVGREFEKNLLGKDKLVLATRLIVAESGKKMSKSEGPLIALTDAPQVIREKVLNTIPDDMVRTMFELCTEVPEEKLDGIPDDPRAAKEALAAELVRMYHGESAVASADEAIAITATGPLGGVLRDAGIAKSMSEAKALISQGAVSVNGVIQKDWDYDVKQGDGLKVGKGKFLKVT